MFSKSVGYALQAIIYLARKRGHTNYISLSELAENLDIPKHYAAKVLQSLSRHKLIKSHKGPNGGFKSIEQASSIALYTIIKAIEPHSFISETGFNLAPNADNTTCPFQHILKDHIRDMQHLLSNTTISSYL